MKVWFPTGQAQELTDVDLAKDIVQDIRMPPCWSYGLCPALNDKVKKKTQRRRKALLLCGLFLRLARERQQDETRTAAAFAPATPTPTKGHVLQKETSAQPRDPNQKTCWKKALCNKGARIMYLYARV